MDLVRASPANAAGGQPTGPTGNPQDPHDSDETVYVEAATAEDLANVTVASVGAGGGGAGGGQPGGLPFGRKHVAAFPLLCQVRRSAALERAARWACATGGCPAS